MFSEELRICLQADHDTVGQNQKANERLQVHQEVHLSRMSSARTAWLVLSPITPSVNAGQEEEEVMHCLF